MSNRAPNKRGLLRSQDRNTALKHRFCRYPPPVDTITILTRLTRTGITETSALDHLRAGRVWVDDQKVTDPGTLVDSGCVAALRPY